MLQAAPVSLQIEGLISDEPKPKRGVEWLGRSYGSLMKLRSWQLLILLSAVFASCPSQPPSLHRTFQPSQQVQAHSVGWRGLRLPPADLSCIKSH